MQNKAIGIFDSGIGGLTVVKEIMQLLPNENIVYLGDTARVPYGTRGKEIITNFATQLTHYLLTKDIKIIVVACNTVSATCLEALQALSPVPVLGVITPAAEKIVQTTKTNQIAILGTPATINSQTYEIEIKKRNPDITVYAKACPLFVPIAEEGLGESEIAYITAQHYLSDLPHTIDTLHLGCTHYPLLKQTIQKVIGEKVTIIDSAIPTAQKLKNILTEKRLLNNTTINPERYFYVTDLSEKTVNTVQLFLGKEINKELLKVNLEDLETVKSSVRH